MDECCKDFSKTSDELLRLYLEGASIQKAAARVGWSRSRAQVFLQAAGVTRTPGEGVHFATRAAPFPVSEELIELIDGLLLGDASIEVTPVSGRLCIGQSGEHRPWIPALLDQLSSFGVACTLSESTGGDAIIKGKACRRAQRTSLRTASYPWFREQWLRWYPGGKKVVPADVRLTAVAVAGWLCGDGVCAGGGYRVEFCTDGFPPENVEWLVAELRSRLKWSPTISHRNRIVVCRQEDRDSLVGMVAPLILPCFQHKIRLKSSKRKMTSAIRAEMLVLRAQGWSIDRLGEKFGVSRTSAYQFLVSAGATTGGPVPRAYQKKPRPQP